MRVFGSFRLRLAVRIGAAVFLLTLAGSAAVYLSIRAVVYEEVDRVVGRLATIEASAMSDSPDETVHFHDEVFVRPSQGGETVLPRSAQVWTVEGEPEIRTPDLGGRNLPLPDEIRRAVARNQRPEMFSLEMDGQRYRSIVYPLARVGPQHRIHLLQVAASTEQADAVLGRVLRVLGLLVLGGAGLASLLGWWLAGHATRPVREIVEQAETLDVEGEDHQVTAHTDTWEFRRLVQVLNSMLERVHETLASQRRFLAEAGHEIRTPLTVLRGDVEVVLRRDRSRSDLRRVLEQALDDLREASRLADDLITLARTESGMLEPEPSPFLAVDLLERVAARYRQAAGEKGITVEVEASAELSVEGDWEYLERAVNNLADNAIKYAGSGGRVLLRARSPSDGRVSLAVIDDGPGVPSEERKRIFERFYRGESARRDSEGSGLGLAIARAIVEAHGGELTLSSEVGVGTEVTIELAGTRVPERQTTG
jgi:heavy metal sensor kinase